MSAIPAAISAVIDAVSSGNHSAAFEPSFIDQVARLKLSSVLDFEGVKAALKKAKLKVTPWSKVVDDRCRALKSASASSDVKAEGVDLLLKIAGERAEVFLSKDGKAYASFPVVCGATATSRLEVGTEFSKWLRYEYFKLSNRSAKDAHIKEAVNGLKARAEGEGQVCEVYRRAANHEGQVWLDIGDSTRRAIQVGPQGWSIVERPSIKFVRTPSMQALPEPQKGGNINKFWQLVNIAPDDRIFVIAWMLEAFRPQTPYPILVLIAHAGHGKSWSQRAIRSLTDPSATALLQSLRQPRDLYATAADNYVLNFENVGVDVLPEISDTMCTIATGGSVTVKANYTDFEGVSLDLKRPQIIGSRHECITAEDLLSRSIILHPPAVLVRSEESELEAEFKRLAPEIFGGMLDVFATALGILPSVDIPAEDRVRMYDFQRFGEAVSRAMGMPEGNFSNAYLARQKTIAASVIEGSVVADSIMRMLERQLAGTKTARPKSASFEQPELGFRGLIIDLFKNLRSWQSDVVGKFPDNVGVFARELRKVVNELSPFGIEVSFKKPGNRSVVEIEIDREKFQQSRGAVSDCAISVEVPTQGSICRIN